MDTAQSRPRFRSDLVAKPFDDAGQRFVDVTDIDEALIRDIIDRSRA